tara:strand:- start:132 stop:308 length:177 start_codon:yes stop_codon:yes gene_type:complete
MGWWIGKDEDQLEEIKQLDCEECGEATDVLDKWKHIPVHICLDCRRDIFIKNIDFVGD